MFWLLNLKSSYYVNRDTLFCYHKASEVFLQRLMALYVASHYKVTETSPQMDLSSEFQLLAVPFYLTFCIFCYPVAQVTIPLGLECPDVGRGQGFYFRVAFPIVQACLLLQLCIWSMGFLHVVPCVVAGEGGKFCPF